MIAALALIGPLAQARPVSLARAEAPATAQIAALGTAPAPGERAVGPAATPSGVEPPAPAWQRFAAAQPEIAGRPMIVIVIDDLGIDRARVARAVALDPSVTLAFLPYAAKVERSAWLARQAHHEILVHLPMEPLGADADPGPHALLENLPRDEFMRRLYWNLGRFGEYVGASNHMGSRLTADWEAMTLVLLELRSRGVLYLDSVTTAKTVGPAIADDLAMPVLRRDVFIDNDTAPEAIATQLARLETIARATGLAIGIAHPHDQSFDALEAWLPGLESRGLVLVPLSTVALRRGARASAPSCGGS